ncbi:phospholipase carboxylesterase protein [Apiospora kogelbergensis]|uniref:phospholipase carboxylesterase protein n=1 Tax=Apiospora kogelbergensis TaxID=1337665 RepID=UPI00312E6CD4
MESLPRLLADHPYLLALVAAAPFLALVYADYRAYVAMGPHGLPDNLQGYIKQLKMRRVSRRDTTVPVPYDDDNGKTKTTGKIRAGSGETSERARRSFFHLPSSSSEKDVGRWELTTRPGEGGSSSSSSSRPRLSHFIAPQRQLEGGATAAMKRDMNAFLDALAAANGEVLLRGLSRFEGTVPAVQAAEGKAAAAVTKETRGEILHVHPADGSTHMVLSLVDSRRVIETGWGERHGLSGGGFLPWGYTLGEFFPIRPRLPLQRVTVVLLTIKPLVIVYAPRDGHDLAVWKKLAVAAMRYCATEVGEIRMPGGCC